MSAKKGRGAKGLKVPQNENQVQKMSTLSDVDSPDMSVIDRASFLEGLHRNHGNPLHSTALEEDLNISEERQTNKGKVGRRDIPRMLKTTAEQHGAAMKRKERERGEENENEEEDEGKKKRSRRSAGGMIKARPEMEGETKKKKGTTQGDRRELDMDRKENDPHAILQKSNQPTPTANRLKHLVGKQPAKGRKAGQTSAVRSLKIQQMRKGKKRVSESKSEKSSGQQSQEDSDSGTPRERHKKILLSDEEVEDEDMSWKPSPKKAKVYSLGRTRKSSSEFRESISGSASPEVEKANSDKRRRKRHGGQGVTMLEVVMDAFLDFCEQYSESVESKAVKQSIACFSSNVKEQLLEKISSYKDLRVLKRENAKVSSLIRAKTQRLLDAKYELMRAKRQACLLKKERADLQLRLTDLRRSRAFLNDIGELNRQYLDFRRKHPKNKEMYGSSSLPALLLETRHIQTAEHQLRGINKRLEKELKNGTWK